MDMIIPHLHRCVSLKFLNLHSFRSYTNILKLPAENIKELQVELGNEAVRDPQVDLDLFSGLAPRLETLHLWSIAIPWNSPVLSHLRYLGLRKLDLSSSTTSSLLGSLDTMPFLEELQLHSVTFGENIGPKASLVHLPRLKSLSLQSLTMSRMLELIEGMYLENCRILDLGPRPDRDDSLHATRMTDVLGDPKRDRWLSETIKRVISLSNWFEIKYDTDLGFSACDTTDPTENSIEIYIDDDPDYASIFRSVASMIGTLDVVSPITLVFEEHSTKSHKDTILSALDMMSPHVRTLTIDNRDKTLLDYLRRPKNESSSWGLPNLQQLNVRAVRPYTLLGFIRDRYGRSHSSRPAPLELLNLDGWREVPPAVMEELERILGKGRVREGCEYDTH